MFSNKGNYEKDIVRFSGKPFEVSYTGENIVAVTIYKTHEVVFVNVMTNTIINTVDIGHRCTRSSSRSMLIRNDHGSYNPSLLVKISLQFLPSGERTTTLFVSLPAT
jgi:hypothetical protein